jgi:predicted nucleotidyltransferase
METRQLTEKNLEITKIYAHFAFPFAEGMLLSGSNAWGAYHAVNANSDVDLLIVANTLDQLRAVIEKYTAEKLLDAKEKERFATYEKLYKERKAEQFSAIGHYLGTAISLDFLLSDAVRDICNLNPMRNQVQENITIRTINEFRTNLPKADGYALDDLKGLRHLKFNPKFQKITNGKEEILGYLAGTLVDGTSNTGNNETYFLGVMSFFLCICPVIVFDKKEDLTRSVKNLQINIAKIIKGAPAHITRQERMSADILQKIKNSLSPL